MVTAILIAIVLGIIAFFVGNLIITIEQRRKESSWAEYYLTGFFSIFLFQGLCFFGATILGVSFEIVSAFVLGGLGFAALVGLFCFRKQKKVREKIQYDKAMYLINGCFLLLIFVIIMQYTVGTRNDAFLETVQASVISDNMNTIHPLTGTIYQQGLILSKKIITLPLFYAAIANVFHVDAMELVYGCGSMITVTLIFALATCYSNLFFETKLRIKQMFLFLVLLLMVSGDYALTSIGTRIFNYGYRGEILITFLAIPYLIYYIITSNRKIRTLIVAICMAGSCLFLASPRSTLQVLLESEKLVGNYFLLHVLGSIFLIWYVRKTKEKKIFLISLLLGKLVVIPLAMCLLYEKFLKEKKVWKILLVYVMIIGMAGSFFGITSNRAYSKTGRFIPEQVYEVLDYLKEKEGVILADRDILDYGRMTEYDLKYLYGKNLYTANMDLGILDEYPEEYIGIYEIMNQSGEFLPQIFEMALLYDCKYIVIKQNETIKIEENKYKKVFENESYYIFEQVK